MDIKVKSLSFKFWWNADKDTDFGCLLFNVQVLLTFVLCIKNSKLQFKIPLMC
jgi:hypothetical protein